MLLLPDGGCGWGCVGGVGPVVDGAAVVVAVGWAAGRGGVRVGDGAGGVVAGAASRGADQAGGLIASSAVNTRPTAMRGSTLRGIRLTP